MHREATIAAILKFEQQVLACQSEWDVKRLLNEIPSNADSLGDYLADSFLLPVLRNCESILEYTCDPMPTRKMICQWEIRYWLRAIRREPDG